VNGKLYLQKPLVRAKGSDNSATPELSTAICWVRLVRETIRESHTEHNRTTWRLCRAKCHRHEEAHEGSIRTVVHWI